MTGQHAFTTVCRIRMKSIVLFMTVLLSLACYTQKYEPMKASEVKKIIFDEYYHKDISSEARYDKLITVLSRWPDSALAFHVSRFMIESLSSEAYREERMGALERARNWTEYCSKVERSERGSRKTAARILLAESLVSSAESLPRRLILEENRESSKEVNEIKTLYVSYRAIALDYLNEIIKNKSEHRFHPLCRLLRLTLLKKESTEQKAFLEKEFSEIEVYNQDFHLLVIIFRFDEELRRAGPSVDQRDHVFQKEFDFIMMQPIDKTPIWVNPILINDAYDIVAHGVYSSELQLKMLERLVPLLNDNNDVIEGRRSMRMEFYRSMANLYLNEGNVKRARESAETGLNLALDEDNRNMFKELLIKIRKRHI